MTTIRFGEIRHYWGPHDSIRRELAEQPVQDALYLKLVKGNEALYISSPHLEACGESRFGLSADGLIEKARALKETARQKNRLQARIARHKLSELMDACLDYARPLLPLLRTTFTQKNPPVQRVVYQEMLLPGAAQWLD